MVADSCEGYSSATAPDDLTGLLLVVSSTAPTIATATDSTISVTCAKPEVLGDNRIEQKASLLEGLTGEESEQVGMEPEHK